MKRSEVYNIVEEEVLYAKSKWDYLPRSERPLKDEEKSVEFWIAHMQNYLNYAREACYGVDKTTALKDIRILAALAIRCMEANGVPGRE